MVKPSQILKKTKVEEPSKDKYDKKKSGKDSMLSWIADKKKC